MKMFIDHFIVHYMIYTILSIEKKTYKQ